jgi:hypothetical protein
LIKDGTDLGSSPPDQLLRTKIVMEFLLPAAFGQLVTPAACDLHRAHTELAGLVRFTTGLDWAGLTQNQTAAILLPQGFAQFCQKLRQHAQRVSKARCVSRTVAGSSLPGF